MRTGRGGARPGAGRKPSRRPVVHHVRRERSSGWTPAIVTLRVVDGIPSLRKRCFILAVQRSFREACERSGFRLVHDSIQTDHLHLIVEADGSAALGCGMKSISARIARAVNRTFLRTGAVLAGRYHVRWLRSPREVRNALRYVLLNMRKHFRQRRGVAPPVRVDAASSGRWFDGWRGRGVSGRGSREVADPRTWLLAVGWRRHRLIGLGDVPG
jgi:REP element-mobilizing transposase RayT